MILQLLLGGVSGIYVVFRIFKQKIYRMVGIRTEPSQPVSSPLKQSHTSEDEESRRRSA